VLAQTVGRRAEDSDSEEAPRLQHAAELFERRLDGRAYVLQDVGGEDEIVLAPERFVTARGIEARLAVVERIRVVEFIGE
jgi:hypothetical protein